MHGQSTEWLASPPKSAQVLNHCYELLAACVRGAEDVSVEMKVGLAALLAVHALLRCMLSFGQQQLAVLRS